MKTQEKDMTIKQRKWLKAYIKTGNASEAAMQVYDCKDKASAGQIGYENMKKLDFGDLMEEMGLTDVVLSNVLAEGLTKAVKTDITGDKHPDYATRHKYLETALKVKKKGITDESTLPDINITFNRGES